MPFKNIKELKNKEEYYYINNLKLKKSLVNILYWKVTQEIRVAYTINLKEIKLPEIILSNINNYEYLKLTFNSL